MSFRYIERKIKIKRLSLDKARVRNKKETMRKLDLALDIAKTRDNKETK